MLILSRKLNESIVIGDRVTVRILRISKDTVKLGIEAPLELKVHREEVLRYPPKDKTAEASSPDKADSGADPEPESEEDPKTQK